MSYIYLLIGILIYIGVVLDILRTTLSMQGGGWFTSRFSHTFWQILLKISGKDGNSKLLSKAGFALLVAIILIWVISLYSSMVFLLYSSPESVINSSTKIPADLWEKMYYAGYVLSTLGIGDFIASNNYWRFITILYSFTGLILITMSVTYFIPVLSAVIKQRKLGINLSTLGNSPQHIILNGWNGKNFDFLVNQLQTFAADILEHNQNHRAYPVIHYFHNHKKKYAIILQIARLNEAVFILQNSLVSPHKICPNKSSSIATALNNYIEVIEEVSHLDITYKNHPYQSETYLLKDLEFFNEQSTYSDQMQGNRLVFLKLVEQDGWEWKDLNLNLNT